MDRPRLEDHIGIIKHTVNKHLPLGMGTIDFASVARGLGAIGFDGLSTIEIKPVGEHHHVIAAAKKQMVQSLAFWRTILEGERTKGAHDKTDAGDALQSG